VAIILFIVCIKLVLTGAMLWALNSKAARSATQQFEQKQIRKHYLAIVRGWTENAGCLVLPPKE
ncbi:pseudouridine synthase, partial [Kingella kingae]|uniref:pseudouridine synthase n=1 Tax=Kingella kingae TaxID=504 RepID=UPI001E654540